MTQYEIYLVEEIGVEREDFYEGYRDQFATTTKELAKDLVGELKLAREDKRRAFEAWLKDEKGCDESRFDPTGVPTPEWQEIEDSGRYRWTYRITPIRLDEPEGQPARDIHAGTYL